jgi:hypothetical protein
MPRPRRVNVIFRKDGGTTSVAPVAGVYGSNRAGTFLSDAKNGTSYLDIVTIGDSNSGSPGNFGYTVGLTYTCANFGMGIYATPMQFTSDTAPFTGNESGNTRYNGLVGPYVEASWRGNTRTDGGTNPITNLESAVAASNATAIALKNAIGVYQQPPQLPTTELGTFVGGVFRPAGFAYGAAFIASGTYTSAAQGTRIRIAPRHPLIMGNGGAAQQIQYRIVYGTFNEGAGNFRMKITTNVADVLAQKTVNTNNGSYGYATETLDFTTTLRASAPIEPNMLAASYDGFGSNPITGPAAFFWHSVIRKNVPGVSVSNLTYNGGHTTPQIYQILNERTGLVKMYLKELRERQIAAGGTGRVLIFMNTGINSSEGGASWTTNANNIRVMFSTLWSELGYTATDLAFLFSVTHPVPTAAQVPDISDIGDWAGARPATAAAANTWGAEAAQVAAGVTVYDIAASYPATKIAALNLYDPFQATNAVAPVPYGAHLRAVLAKSTTVAFPDVANEYLYTSEMDFMQADNGYIKIAQAILDSVIKAAA